MEEGRRPYHGGVPAWVIWMLLAAAFTAGEVMTTGFLLGFLAIAAVLGALAALVGLGVELQVTAFIVGSVASLAVLRPIARRHLRAPAQIRTGAAALVGTQATVIERVHADGGSVRLRGEVWSARPYDDSVAIEPGTRVEVLKIRGATALVSE